MRAVFAVLVLIIHVWLGCCQSAFFFATKSYSFVQFGSLFKHYVCPGIIIISMKITIIKIICACQFFFVLGLPGLPYSLQLRIALEIWQ